MATFGLIEVLAFENIDYFDNNWQHSIIPNLDGSIQPRTDPPTFVGLLVALTSTGFPGLIICQ